MEAARIPSIFDCQKKTLNLAREPVCWSLTLTLLRRLRGPPPSKDPFISSVFLFVSSSSYLFLEHILSLVVLIGGRASRSSSPGSLIHIYPIRYSSAASHRPSPCGPLGVILPYISSSTDDGRTHYPASILYIISHWVEKERRSNTQDLDSRVQDDFARCRRKRFSSVGNTRDHRRSTRPSTKDDAPPAHRLAPKCLLKLYFAPTRPPPLFKLPLLSRVRLVSLLAIPPAARLAGKRGQYHVEVAGTCEGGCAFGEGTG